MNIGESPMIKGHEVVKFEPSSEGGLKRWECYLGDMLACCHINNACIYSLESTQQLASSHDDFKLSEEEFIFLTKGITLPNLLRENGIPVSGRVYNYHVGDGKFGVMGKSGQPPSGCTVCKTQTLLLVATHDDKMKPKVCNETVMILGDFFVAKGL